ncbi:MAG: response regulator transcription factor [Proteobacteria bacterium]|nr:response regulator transcription factor [Pseudomonadota bacterium]
MRILLVEDEKKLCNLIARALEAERYAVAVALDGNTAWEMAQAHDYDLIILDLMLPQLSGTEVLRRVRHRNREVPILILSARDLPEAKLEHFEAGADDYVTKPFVLAELVMRVKALLRRGSLSRAAILRVGDLEVDRLLHQVKRDGHKIELTPKEYSLLEYLATNPGRVLSRTTIIEHVWDRSFEGLNNIVDVYVRHLRRKVDDPFPTKLIRMVRGVGYGLTEG